MRRSIWLISIILLACGSTQKLTEQTPARQQIRPAWVDSKPISSIEYIGIGRALKGNGDHALLAKRSALNDLASEIEVTVSSESVMYTLDHDERFEESYTEAIFLNTDLDLEGFHAYDSWENESEYWMCYRLDKKVYHDFKEKERQDAITRSSSELEAAFDAFAQADPTLVAAHCIRVLEILRPYWNMPNPSDRFSDIGMEAVKLLGRCRAALEFTGVSDQVLLSESSGFRSRIVGSVEMNGNVVRGGGVSVSRDAEVMDFPTSYYDFEVKPVVGGEGKVSMLFDPFVDLRKNSRAQVTDPIQGLLTPIRHELTVHAVYPPVSLDLLHTGVDMAPSDGRRLRAEFVHALNLAGIPVTGSADAQYEITLVTHSRDGGVSFGQQVVWTGCRLILHGNAEVKNTDELLIGEVKGIHLDLASAQRKSVEKLGGRFSDDLLEALIDGLF